jgi:hypothetical protein
MALKDLNGRRTGRPRGAKTKSRVKRDIEWAYRHLGKPDADPPTEGAKLWLDLARREPDNFLAHVVRLETAEEKKLEAKLEQAHADWDRDEAGDDFILNQGRPARVAKMFLSEAQLWKYLKGESVPPIANLRSYGTKILGCKKPRSGAGVILFLGSWSFDFVETGEPIPEFKAEYCNKRRI